MVLQGEGGDCKKNLPFIFLHFDYSKEFENLELWPNISKIKNFQNIILFSIVFDSI